MCWQVFWHWPRLNYYLLMLKITFRYFVTVAVLCLPAIHSIAQDKKTPVTAQVSIEGKVKHPFRVSGTELDTMDHATRDSIVIYNHLMEKRKTLKMVSGVPLKELLQQAEIDVESPKDLSEYYITCVAADGYKVVFSWNELFNTATGQKVMLITGADGKSLNQLDDRIALITPEDVATGRRYVKGLSKVIVSRIK